MPRPPETIFPINTEEELVRDQWLTGAATEHDEPDFIIVEEAGLPAPATPYEADLAVVARLPEHLIPKCLEVDVRIFRMRWRASRTEMEGMSSPPVVDVVADRSSEQPSS